MDKSVWRWHGVAAFRQIGTRSVLHTDSERLVSPVVCVWKECGDGDAGKMRPRGEIAPVQYNTPNLQTGSKNMAHKDRKRVSKRRRAGLSGEIGWESTELSAADNPVFSHLAPLSHSCDAKHHTKLKAS